MCICAAPILPRSMGALGHAVLHAEEKQMLFLLSAPHCRWSSEYCMCPSAGVSHDNGPRLCPPSPSFPPAQTQISRWTSECPPQNLTQNLGFPSFLSALFPSDQLSPGSLNHPAWHGPVFHFSVFLEAYAFTWGRGSNGYLVQIFYFTNEAQEVIHPAFHSQFFSDSWSWSVPLFLSRKVAPSWQVFQGDE